MALLVESGHSPAKNGQHTIGPTEVLDDDHVVMKVAFFPCLPKKNVEFSHFWMVGLTKNH